MPFRKKRLTGVGGEAFYHATSVSVSGLGVAPPTRGDTADTANTAGKAVNGYKWRDYDESESK